MKKLTKLPRGLSAGAVGGVMAFAIAGCCGGDKASPSAGTAAASSSSVAASAPTNAPGTPGEVVVSKVAKPLKDWQHEDVKNALERAGWTINGSTQTKSAMLSIVVNATKGDSNVRVSYYNPGGAFWKKTLEKDGAVLYEEGEILVGVVMTGDKNAAQKLLDGLVGK
jgi:hypothetical protein